MSLRSMMWNTISKTELYHAFKKKKGQYPAGLQRELLRMVDKSYFPG